MSACVSDVGCRDSDAKFRNKQTTQRRSVSVQTGTCMCVCGAMRMRAMFRVWVCACVAGAVGKCDALRNHRRITELVIEFCSTTLNQ